MLVLALTLVSAECLALSAHQFKPEPDMHMHETAGCSGWDKKSVQRALRWILGTSKFRIWHGVTLDDFYVRFEGGRYVWVRTRRGFYLIAITDEGGGYSGLRLADPAELKPKPEMDTKVFRLED